MPQGGVWLGRWDWLHHFEVVQEFPSNEMRSRYGMTWLSLFLEPCSCVLCLSGQNASAARRKEAEKAPGSRTEHHQALRTAYLSDVQRALDKSSYSQFYSALLAYKKTDNYDEMVSVIAALTTERPQDFHLLQSKDFLKITLIYLKG